MPQQLPMFLPLGETQMGNVFLPGLAGDPRSQTQALFPPGTYPIMGSGEYTGTLYPLADPVPPQPMPLPPEVQSVAMQPGAMAGGIEPMPMQGPPPQEILAIPPSPGAEVPGLEPLTSPLPTSMPSFQQPWPPFPEPLPQVPLMPPGTPTMPAGIDLQGALPAPATAEPMALTQQSGIVMLAEAIANAREQQKNLEENAAGRNTLRTGIPAPNLGQVVWEQEWGK